MAEMVDVVDEDDRVRRQVTRAEMRRGNLWHRAVYIVVVNTVGFVFVHRRTQTKDVYPGYWDVTVGGVVAAGEDYLSAALRELREELGIVAGPLACIAPVRYEDPHTRLLGVGYLATHDGTLELQADEIESGNFVSLAEAERMLGTERCCPDGALVLRAYLARRAAATI